MIASFHTFTRINGFNRNAQPIKSRISMQQLKIKKGYRFRMDGGPATTLTALADPNQVAVLPSKIPHIKPRLKVAEGDEVKIGSLLFEDKRNNAFQFLSPAGGTIRRIAYGSRRAIEAIVIDREPVDEPQIEFPTISKNQLTAMSREALVGHILKGGLWWTLRQMPFRDLCRPDTMPPLILVGLDAKEPFQPNPEVYLRGRLDLLAYGIQVLEKLSQSRVFVYTASHRHALVQKCKPFLTHTVAGHYPADDPGTVLYHTKDTPDDNSAWYINGQDLLLLAQLLKKGRYPVERVVSVAGSAAPIQQHFRTRMGVPLSHLADPASFDDSTRVVVGGLLTGYTSVANGFMGLYETALNLVPAGKQAEFLALFKPGIRKPSFSRAFLSTLNTGQLSYNCNLNGELRPCIACMHCADVCPVDILPQLAFKAVLAEEVEEALEHGLLDCVACGLCSFVCPSKIELSQTLMAAKADYAKETGAQSTS